MLLHARKSGSDFLEKEGCRERQEWGGEGLLIFQLRMHTKVKGMRVKWAVKEACCCCLRTEMHTKVSYESEMGNASL